MRNVLVIKACPSLASLIEEVVGVLPANASLSCGDLLGACLIDTTSYGVGELVGQWVGRSIPVAAVLDAIRRCHKECSDEGPVRPCAVGDAIINFTGWASFILRFVDTCEPIQEFSIFAGLVELQPPSVVAMLDNLGLAGATLRASLDELGIQMIPAIERCDDPHVQEATSRYHGWLFSPANVSLSIGPVQSGAEILRTMLAWLSEEYRELPLGTSFRRGDIVLFALDCIQDLCVLGTNDRWQSLTSRESGESIAEPKNAVRAFRPPQAEPMGRYGGRRLLP